VKTAKLGDIMLERGGSLHPARFPDEEFELYSIPAHDKGGPEVVVGAAIGSSKQIVQPGDVMISKIIPHIRRARVVAPANGRRQIASGEWIVFRGDAFVPNYLRHFLLSDDFHRNFMNTVAGVGGSLVRARPAQVREISLPLPPIDEQRRIAAILDRADAIRAKRRQVLAHLDSLVAALFQARFGSLAATTELQDVCVKITDGTHQPPEWTDGGVPFLFVSNITSGEIDLRTKKFISFETWATLTRRSPIEVGDVLYSTVGSFGIPALVSTTEPFAFQRHIAHIKPDMTQIDPVFLAAQMASPALKRQASGVARGVAQPTVNLGDIRKFKIVTPPLAEQRSFADMVERVRAHRIAIKSASRRYDELFASLQSRAFRGEM